MLELLLALSFWPWALLCVLLASFIASSATENMGFAVIGAILYFSLAWVFFSSNPFVWVYQNPAMTLSIVAIYCAAGAAWSMFKWYKRITSQAVQVKLTKAKTDYDQKNPGAGPKDYFSSPWFPLEAQPSRNKDAITAWIAFWPLSVIGYFFGELLVDFFGRIYAALASTYENITTRFAP